MALRSPFPYHSQMPTPAKTRRFVTPSTTSSSRRRRTGVSAGRLNPARPRTRALTPSSPCRAETSVGLPFFQIEGTVVEWDEVKFDVRLMQRVPYEGVSRMQTSLRRKHRDRVVRRGLALIIESECARATLSPAPTTASAHAPPLPAAPQLLRHRRGPRALRRPAHLDPLLVGPRPFLATPLLGHAHSRPSRVPRSVQETCNFDVLYACAATTQTGAARVFERLVAPYHCALRAQVPHGRELRLQLR